MADNTLKTRLLSAYNTLDFWSTCTIIPLGGEVCYGVDDDNKILEIKIGDGVHKYSELPAQSFDNEDHLYQLATLVSTAADASNFTATTYLKVNNGLGSTSYDNSSSAILTIPSATTAKAGLMSASDKEKLEKYGVPTTSIGTPSSTSKNIPTDYAVWKAIDDMPEPMLFKGSVGTGGTTASLPTTGLSAYEGWTYKVITDGTYGGVAAKVGDTLICNGSEWILIPSGDEPSGTVTSVGLSSTATDSPLTVTGSPITSSGTIDIEHAAGNTTTAKYGATATKSGIGGTVNVPFIQADKYGHVTSAGHYKFTAPTEAQIKAVKVNNASTADFATSAGDAAKLNGVDASNFLQADDISAGTGITVTTAAGAATVSANLATTTVEGITKKPSGTAPIAVSDDNVISHNNSGVTAGTYGAAQTASFAGNVAIPSIKVDAKGHVTTAGTVNVKMPSTAGLGTSAKDIKSIAWQFNTNSGNTANNAKITVTLNDNNTIVSNIITNTLILDGNFTS